MKPEATIEVGKHKPVLLYSIEKDFYWKCEDLALQQELNLVLKDMMENEAKKAHIFGPDVGALGQSIATYCTVTLKKGKLLSFKDRPKKIDYVP